MFCRCTRRAILAISVVVPANIGAMTGAVAAPPNESRLSTRPEERDPAVDHGFISTHAESIGEGQWRLSNQDLLLFTLSYGVTDALQVSLASTPPVPPLPYFGGLSAKYVLKRTDTYVVALRGGVGLTNELARSHAPVLGVYGVGPLIDVYVDRASRFAFHGGITVGDEFATGVEDAPTIGRGLIIALEAGFSGSVHENIKVILEGQMLLDLTTTSGLTISDLKLFNYGARFHNADIAVDVGMMRPFGDLNLDGWIFGFPYLGLTGAL